MKLHLPASVPSEGARRVAQWVMGLPGGLSEAAKVLSMPASWVQRIVEGDMVPGLATGTRLHLLMGLRAREFRAKPTGWWFEDAAGAPLQRRAA